MTKWLASVQSLAEVQSLATQLPDIVDMKNPAQGALGALATTEVARIVNWLNGRCLSSATVGDLVMQADVIAAELQNMAATGVDYVKVGLFTDTALLCCINQLEITVKNLKTPVIAVIFADQEYLDSDKLILALRQAGFAGVMVDTAYKNGQTLRDHWSEHMLQHFVEQVKAAGMLCGLAGALRIDDIAPLQRLGAHYLGFRSALCEQRCRTASLLPQRAKLIQQQLQTPISLAG